MSFKIDIIDKIIDILSVKVNVVEFTRTPRMRSAGSWSSVSDCEDEDDAEAGDAGTNVINILNSLEQMGYKVVTSGAFVASQSVNNNKVR